MDNSDRLCLICREKEFKYKCPGCSMATCSLKCCSIHKVEFECDGKPAITFKKIKDFDDEQLLKDFGFLEEGSKLLDCFIRDRKNIVKSMDQLPPWLKKLVFEARCRGTRLKLLPAGFEKRIKNKTTFMYDQKIIKWDVGLVFTHITEKGMRIEKPSSLTVTRVDEHKTLREILEEVINPKDVLQRLDIWKLLTSYRLADESKLLVLLFAEKQFFKVDPNQSLAKTLQRKTIIECPTFIITFDEFADQFPVINIEDETNNVTVAASEKDFSVLNTENSRKRGKNKKRKRKPIGGLKSHIEPKIAKTEPEASKEDTFSHGTTIVSTLDKQLGSDVSSLSTSDDEDYQKFLNIGFARQST